MTEQQRMDALRMAASVVHRLASHGDADGGFSRHDTQRVVGDLQGLLEAIGLRQLDSRENSVVAARRAVGETE